MQNPATTKLLTAEAATADGFSPAGRIWERRKAPDSTADSKSMLRISDPPFGLSRPTD
jgi:hypothetical protein